MNATQQFIEDAIAGGWYSSIIESGSYRIEEYAFLYLGHSMPLSSPWARVPIHEILLDPLAWQAVGKVRGWDKYKFISFSEKTKNDMLMVMEEIVDGKTIEEALQAIN
jgi:hypothetical protein